MKIRSYVMALNFLQCLGILMMKIIENSISFLLFCFTFLKVSILFLIYQAIITSNVSDSDCGFILNVTSEIGRILSPNFPFLTSTYSNCTWLLIAPEGEVISIVFDHFDMSLRIVSRHNKYTGCAI